MSAPANQRASGRRSFLRTCAALAGGGVAITIARDAGGGRAPTPTAGEPIAGARRVNVAPGAVPSVRR